jgi:phospholipid transport system substrate-binding protein
MKIVRNWVWLLGLIWPLMSLAGTPTPPDPEQVVRDTAEYVLSEVTARKAELDVDPSLIYPLVKRTVVPHFDFTSMARSAMGRFWRNATPQQQERVVAEFQELLVRTYATALLGYSGQKIEYLPMRAADQAKRVTVQTRISAAGGPPIPINYSLKLEDGKEWLVYDVVIDGVSLVTNYRSSFTRLIQQGAAQAKDRSTRMQAGIDNLIQSLADKNRDVGKKAAQNKESA